MKKILLLLAVLLSTVTMGYSQASFTTGVMGVDVNEYGKIEILNSAGIYQNWRTSILVGTSSTSVFDYQNDAEQNEPTVLVGTPLMSDFEIFGAYDNTYSEEPPAVVVKLNAYGWTNGGYIIVKFNIKNNEASTMNAVAGLDIIPYIDEIDGYDSVSYLIGEEVIHIYRGGAETNQGIKLLSGDLTSLYSFEYYDDYYVDSDYWTWMNYGSLQPLYASDSDFGSVSITAQAPVELAPGESFDVYYAIAVGADEQTMLANIAAAADKYESWFGAIGDLDGSSTASRLDQNCPNPFSQTTKIGYQLNDNGFVSLKVYNSIGKEVAVLVDADQTQGYHISEFNAGNLPVGMYYYTLRCNGQVQTHKMFVVK